MITHRRRAGTLLAPTLLALSLTACGGGSDAPEDASKEDFCEAYNAEPDLDESLETAEPEEQAKAVKKGLEELADELEEVGTPKDIPDDARKGFEAEIDAVRDLDEDDIKKAFEEDDEEFFDSIVTGDDKKNSEKFNDWAEEYCG